MTPALAPSTDSRSCIVPGFASKTTRDNLGAVDAATASGTRPRKIGEPSVATAMTDTRDG